MPKYGIPYKHHFHRDDGSTVVVYDSPSNGYWEIVVDTEDFDRIKDYRWCLIRDRRTSYAQKTNKNNNGIRSSVSLHRFILNNPKGIIDHKDGHGLNNRKSNLRIASILQNRANSKTPSTNKSGFKGVCYSSRDKAYIVWLTVNRKRYYGGRFQNILLAANKYNEMASEKLGEFARLNRFTAQQQNELMGLNKKELKRVKNNKYGFVGVGVDNDRKNKYKASIWNGEKLIRIGNYPTMKDAAIAYNETAIKLFGQTARLNKIL